MNRAHVTVAIICAIGGLIALTVALAVGRPISLGSLLGMILLLNALVRFQLARRL